MIVLFTDFGLSGPYMGQLQAAIFKESPAAQVVNLFADAPAHDARRSAYLLAAYAGEFPAPTVFVCVVDPGVGSDRRALALEAGGRWFVGPDNGLLGIVARRAPGPAWWRIAWRPERLSASFHGRDLFAPVAAWLDRGERPQGASAGARPPGADAPKTSNPAADQAPGHMSGRPAPPGADAPKTSNPAADQAPGHMSGRPAPPAGWAELLAPDGLGHGNWPDDLAEVIYIDRFGNAMTGLRAATLSPHARITLSNGREIVRARTFSDVPKGGVFWYENANGLAEIAVNCGRADAALGLALGSPVIVGL